MAFFSVLSIPSLLTLAITIAGQVFGEQNARQFILGEAGMLISPEAENALRTILRTAERPQGFSIPTIISIAVLFFSASGVLVQLQDALNTIWGVKPDPEQGIMAPIKQRAFSFLLIIFIGLLVIALFLVNTLISGLGQSLNDILPFSFGWARLLTTIVSFIIYTLLIMAIFKVIPDAQIAWRDVGIGAIVTALLLSAGIIGLNLYFQYSDLTTSYGAAGSFLALLIWIYYSAQILFIGAEFTQVYAQTYGGRINPDEDAVWDPAARPLNNGPSNGHVPSSMNHVKSDDSRRQ